MSKEWSTFSCKHRKHIWHIWTINIISCERYLFFSSKKSQQNGSEDFGLGIKVHF
ncbi:transmembrane protein 70 mitochondrial [Biomphalaria pfeifferi]|uniref:Transmembrane protein 70 mitochondrial n=1 Tax=Biomphalaria pfeifferi TaxID=112525 RepID=A0AAD8B2U8_BIOPF|nr:transmembrane protein 70 mitochondrial [Biomphalaria pfeifferi]